MISFFFASILITYKGSLFEILIPFAMAKETLIDEKLPGPLLINIEKSLLLLSGDLCELDLKDKNHKLIDQFVIKKLPVIQNSIIEDMNFLSERGKILNNGIVSVNIILNKKLDILKSELHTKGFPFEFDKEFIQEQIKESLLNKILFMKDEMNERSLHDQLEDIAKKTFSKNFSLKPELLIHLSIV